jgi:Cdc6-like AAA superfamily ATPase
VIHPLPSRLILERAGFSARTIRQLETIVEERGEETLVPSEVTVIEIMAAKRKNGNSGGTEEEN